jgi:Ca2+-binding RTX toxin-like protein
VNTMTAGEQANPAIARMQDGRYFAVWTDYGVDNGTGVGSLESVGGSGTAIRGQVLKVSGSNVVSLDGPEFLVNTFTANDQREASVATAADGRVLVVWSTNSGVLDSDWGISGQWFDPRDAGVTQYLCEGQFLGTLATDLLIEAGSCPSTQKWWGAGGNDFFFSGQLSDELHGGDGIDYLDGGAGNDSLFGDGGGDNIQSGSGNDYAVGGAGHDFVFGLEGDDVLYGDAQNTDAGIDTILGGPGNDTVYGLAGTDVLYGGDGSEVGSGIDVLLGGDNTDWIFAEDGNDVLYGEAGSDLLYPGAGTDWVYTGPDPDWVFLTSGAGTDVIADWTNGQDFFVFNGSQALGVPSFPNLSITQGSGYTAVSYGTGNILIVMGATVDQFDPSDFYFA